MDSQQEQRFINLVEELKQFRNLDCYPAGFNMFEAVGMAMQEIKHSNFLGFLLDPSAPHSFGDEFVRCFLGEAAKNSADASFSPLVIALGDLSDIQVNREWGYAQFSKRKIDIVLVSRNNKTVYAIENKVGASESENQLHDYRASIENYPPFLDYEKRYVFLTPDSTDPSDPAWSTVSYEFVVSAIDSLAASHRQSLSPGLNQVMSDYTKLLRRYVVDDEKLMEACRQIYRRHKNELDLIFQHGDVNRGKFADAAEEFLSMHEELELRGVFHPKRFAFLPRELSSLMQEYPDINWHKQSKPLLAWFGVWGDKIQLILEVGPLSDKDRRSLAVKELRKIFGYKTSTDKDPTGLYSRCWTRSAKIGAEQEDEMSKESLLKAMEQLWGALSKLVEANLKEIVKVIQALPRPSEVAPSNSAGS